jgi:hypothetical protein
MKRTKKKVEKRTYALKNAFPRFVSIVDRGANLIPLSELRFSEDGTERFADVDINRIVFSKEVFKDKEAVESYLQENNYEEYSIDEVEETFVVAGTDADKFSDIQNIEYDDGVMYFIGKLKEEIADEPVTAIVESEAIDSVEGFSEETPEVASEDAAEEVVAQSEEFNEEAQPEEVNTSGEEGEGGDSPEAAEVVQESQEEVVTESEETAASVADSTTDASEIVQESDTPVVEDKLKTFLTSEKYGEDYTDFRHQITEAQENRSFIMSFDYVTYVFNDCSFSALYNGDMDQFKKNCADYFKVVKALVDSSKNLSFSDEEVLDVEEATEEKFSFTKEDLEALIEEKLQKYKEKEQPTIDETEIIIQNRQSTNSDELIVTNDKAEKNERVEKFNAQTKKDLFGIR